MITISAFGSFQIIVDGQQLVLPNRKSQALLIYLASSRGEQHARSMLAEMFWPELPEAAALNNLSKALGQIRKLVEKIQAGVEPIEATRHTVHMISPYSWQLDATLFYELVEEARVATNAAASAALLEEAVALYRGEFLAGLSLEDSPTFEGWLLLQREKLMLMARDSHQRLADYYLRLGAFKAARDHASRQLALDAWYEEGHRLLMRALDGMGQRAAALAQYEVCRQILRTELGLEPEADTRELYEQIKAGNKLHDRQTAAQPSPIQLPDRLLPLVGRERELAALQKDLADPACRLITIVGPGGVGKTSLALEAARQAAPDFAGGAAFVPLEHHQPALDSDLHDLLAIAVGTALELTFSGREPIPQQLYKQLRDTEMLLLLDNFEHLMLVPDRSPAVNCASFISALLEQAPGIKILLTAREPFALPAEFVLSLDGLPVPDTDAGLPALAEYSGVRLFVEQAHRIQRDFRLTDDNGADVVQICRLVDGLPLGIELAARWVPHFTLTEIAEAIQENIDFLAAESPQLTARHQSLRATISYSWQMLTPGEKQMLESLSIISGRFSRQAALSITGGSLGSLVRLQGKSLLRQESPGQYSLHPILRQYLAERLAKQPADVKTDLHERFFAHYLELLAREGEGLDDERSGETIKEIAHHIDNIRNAWEMAYEASAFELLDKGLQPLYLYYRIKGLFREGKQLFAESSADFQSTLNQDSHNVKVRQLLGRAQLRQGRLAWLLGDTAQAIALFQSGLDHLKHLPSPSDLSRAHAYLSEAALRDGRIDDAEHLLDIALTRYQQEEDNTGIATTLAAQALLASQNQQYEEVDRLFEKSIRLSQQNANRRLEGRSLHDWGVILIQLGNIEQAANRLRESQVIARDLNLHMPIAFNQIMLARTDRHLGDTSHARRRLVEGLKVLEGSGYAFYTICALNMLGEVEVILGKSDEAKRPLEKALFRLNYLQTADSSIFTFLALDFLIATAYLFAATRRDDLAGHYLRLALAHINPESDLDQRALQLTLDLSKRDLFPQEIPVRVPTAESSLVDVLRDIQL